LDVFELNGDAMIHQMFVEWCAVQYGDVDAIQRIVRAAAGEGADQSPQFIRHARRVLAKVPAADLDAVLDTVDPTWLAKLAQEIR
jgi:putative chitinase